MTRFLLSFVSLACLLVHLASAACPMAELARRGMAPEELTQLYHRGEGLNLGHLEQARDGAAKTHDNADETTPPAALDPLSGILSPLGLGGLLPRFSDEHKRDMVEHVLARQNEPDEQVNIDAPILTPKAHKRYVEERGLIGGLLAPLSGILQAIDIPTPQESGLKEIPGDDPNHQYQAPGPTDVRGNCPTLNTLANHGYLSRSGITSLAEAANAVQTAFSMSFDIAVFLSAFGLLAGGDLVTGKYSIAGKDSRVPNTLGNSLGIDRHGTFELDASISRSDYAFGDSHSFNGTKWDALVNDANKYGGGLFTIEAFQKNAAAQAKASRATNPQYENGANFIVNGATRALTLRPLPNGTTENVPDYANIAPFFLNETFPPNWYRRADSYSLADLLVDAADILLADPQPLGRNYDGRFVPSNISLPKAPADVGCLGVSLLAGIIPGQLAGEAVTAGNAVVNQLIVPLFGGTKCDIDSYDAAGVNNVRSNSYNVTNEDAGSGSGVTGLGQHEGLAKTSKYTRRAVPFGRA